MVVIENCCLDENQCTSTALGNLQRTLLYWQTTMYIKLTRH